MTSGCEVDANTADTFSGTVAATFRNGAVLDANTAGAVSGGLLQLPTFDAVINANVANAITGGTLVINGTVNALATGAIDGAWLRLGGDGVVNIGAANATTVITDLEFGSQAVTAGGLLSLNGYGTVVGRITNYTPSGRIVNGGVTDAALTIGGSALGDSSFGGEIADGAGGGTLALVKRGVSTLTLSGSNTYAGGTRIEAGTLRLEGSGTLGAPTGELDIAGGATLVFDTTALTVGSLSGSGTITRSDFNPGLLTVDQATNTTFSGAITDYFDEINGVTTMTGLTKSGTGTLTLTGDNAYTGTTDVTGGTLLVDGSLGNVMWGPIVLGTSSVAIASGGSLGGAGSIAGDVSVASGGILLGRAGQTLSMGSLALNGGSVVNVSLGAPGNTRLFNVAGNLTLAGTLNVSDAGGFGNGLYRLFDAATITNNGLAIGTTPGGYAAGDLTVQTTTNQVNLLVGASAAGSYSFWNGAQTTANNMVNGGTGTWSAAATNWTNANGSASGVYDPAAMQIFQGTPGTVTVDAGGGALEVGGGMQFFVDGYKVTGDALNVTAAATPIRVGDGTAAGAGMTATISSVIGGSGGIDKTDLGTLVLSRFNTYAGGTTISAGTLKFDVDLGGTLGAPTGALAIAAGGTFDLTGTSQTVGALSGAGSITSSMYGGRQSLLTVNQATDTSFSGAITDGYMTGAGDGGVWLIKGGAGTLTLAGNSAFAFMTVDGGTLAIANGGKVANLTSYIGEVAGSNGTMLVTGIGSVWTTDYLRLGYQGAGTLTVADGGRVSTGVGTVDMVRTSSASGTLNLNGTAGARGVLETNNVWKGHDGATVNFDGGILRATTADADLLGHFAAGDVTIKAGGAFIDSNGYDVEISSALGGVGALTKQGAGELYLIGANTYQGGTNIEAGRLFLGEGGTLGAPAGSLFVASGATLDLGITSQTVGLLSGEGEITSTVTMGTPSLLIVDQATDSTFGGTIRNGMQLVSPGSSTLPAILVPTVVGLTKSGSGTLTLSGSNIYTGNTNVTGGTLLIDGALSNTHVAVASGAALGGTGTITGTVTVFGRLFAGTGASGAGIGTMDVVGDVTFNTGSTYQVAANAAGQASHLDVTGPATISGGTVSVLAGAGSYNPQTDYTILSASGGVSGVFADVTSNLAFLDPSLSYDADNVYLRLHRNNVSFASLGLTANQIATGGGAESLGSGNPLYDAVLQLPATAAARDALDQLSGEIHASAKGMLLGDGRFVRDAATNRISAAFGDGGVAALPIMAYGEGGPEMVAADTDRFAVWGQAFGSWGSTHSDGNAAAFDRSTGGLLAGADTSVGGWRVGLLGGYSHSSFDAGDGNSTGKSESYHLGLYGGTNWRAIAFRTGAAYSWSRLSTRRSVAFDGFADALSADYDAGTAQVFGELAYRADAGQFKFEPFANLAYVSLRTDGFAEQGGPAALAGSGSTTDATFATLGLRGSTDFAFGAINATARGMLGWRHDFGDVTPSTAVTFAGGDRFTIAGVPIGRDTALIEAGLDLLVAPNAKLDLSYTGQFGGGGVDQGAKVDLGVTF